MQANHKLFRTKICSLDSKHSLKSSRWSSHKLENSTKHVPNNTLRETVPLHLPSSYDSSQRQGGHTKSVHHSSSLDFPFFKNASQASYQLVIFLPLPPKC